MAPFRLQKLLDLKTWRERERAAAVEAARAAAGRANAALERLHAMRADNLHRLQHGIGAGRSVGELLSQRGVLEQIEQLTVAARAEQERAQRALDETLAAFAQATSDRRSFEKLKERHNDVTRKAVNAAERANLDEVGLRRHLVRQAGGSA